MAKWPQNRANFLSVVNPLSKIRCHGNRGRQGRNLYDSVGWLGPENRGVGANSAQLSFTGTELYDTALKSP